MRAYYFDNLPGDQRLPHDSSRPVAPEHLNTLNVELFHIPVTGDYQEKVDVIAKERNYRNRDTINITREGLGDQYETKLKMFFDEHLHEDEEIRYLLDGSGYFDVRETPSDAWIRIALSAGDLLVLPAGIYHRFTLDEENKVSALRLFKAGHFIILFHVQGMADTGPTDEPKWAAITRGPEADHNKHRVEYLRSIAPLA